MAQLAAQLAEKLPNGKNPIFTFVARTVKTEETMSPSYVPVYISSSSNPPYQIPPYASLFLSADPLVGLLYFSSLP